MDERFYLPVCGLAVAATGVGLQMLAAWAGIAV